MPGSDLVSVFLAQRRPLLRTLVRMVQNEATAEDLLQDTYLRAASALGRQPIEHPAPFLFQTARNLALDHLRRARRQPAVSLDTLPRLWIETLPARGAPLEDQLDHRRLLDSLQRTLTHLTPRQQTIFALSRLHGLGPGAIAEHLGVSPSTVQKELKLITALCSVIRGRLH